LKGSPVHWNAGFSKKNGVIAAKKVMMLATRFISSGDTEIIELPLLVEMQGDF
jgi:hypothetical protein